ncbi:FAD-dependent oxidoreductase [Pararhodobacter sp. CCB-MM2]|uniref:FAD-dependent oxidoreductase n=1 Tax=Pararhodobacter sp. CCB-MM2 TaxID=1786003 RepID=UPI000830CF4D|nr:FAD-dependent oxidoreductase [Pararhodobacter sp. CCB-MM2]
MDQIQDVIIVGGGPVGMGLAIDLAQRGHSVAVVERYAQPQPVPKGQNLTQRTMEHMQAWGCEAEIRAARSVPKGYGIGGLTSHGTLLSGYHYDWLQRDLVRPYYATDNERLPQYATEEVLRARAAQLPNIALHYGMTATAVVQDADGVSVTMEPRKGGEAVTLRGRYAVGSDGSRSFTRAEAGITETLRDHDRKMVLLVFDAPELHRLLERYPEKQFYNVLHPDLEGYWLFFGRVDLKGRFFFHAPVPLDTTRDNFDFTAYLHRAAGADFPVTFDHIGFWDLRIAIADSYRKDRILIAGDAAHSHPPYGGFGINTGFEDARNLGWKLSAVLQGWAGEGLLDSYDAERRPVFASTARDFIEKFIHEDRAFLHRYDPSRDRAAFEAAWNARASGATAEVNAFEPNYEGSPVVVDGPAGQPSASGRHVFRAEGGHHLPPRGLSDGRSVYDALDGGFTLIALDRPEAEVSAFQAEAAALGLPLTILRDTRDGERTDWGAGLILVRPDAFVAWTGEEARDPARVLKGAIGATS